MSGNGRGILYMVLAMGGFAVEDTFIKLLAQRGMPPGQILLVLGLLGMAGFAVAARARGQRFLSRRLLHPMVLGRNLGEMLGTFGYVLAVALAPLTTATAIFQATPLATTMAAALILREPVGWRRWTAIGVGFAGVLLIVRPGTETFQAASLLALLAVVGLSARDLFTRRVPPATDSILLAGWGFGAVALVGALQLVVTGGAVRPVGAEGPWLLAATVAGAAGYWLLTESTRMGELSVIMPFRYSRLLFAMGIGIVVFAERPDLWTLVGAVMIVGSGVYSLLRERARARAALSPAAVAR
ncbi:DMT family transporter [Rubellimicrobium aerolatum]|uniref:DMT family transporter n=1 Tax=Rubellimicrobium aerolatum TaxID=490979 RepID=A0ABW0S652_9RHOB|nr:DMT family transporter [Rubellimicrobium aerolatum]MBP1804488.1 drug/metabolite transporter (DMT)-like permease [Rubellimicrobium aerolatum]